MITIAAGAKGAAIIVAYGALLAIGFYIGSRLANKIDVKVQQRIQMWQEKKAIPA